MVVGIYVVRTVSERPTIEQQVATQLGNEKIIGRIGSGYFNFELANSPTERNQGLSGRQPLKSTEGMIFAFDEPGQSCFWMKDMKFNLDILWFDENKKLIYEKHDVSPDTYPESFCSDIPAKYVVEVTAGVATKNQIKLGDKLDIEL
ncbi:DUF192 domain-containing protein [Candidatus Saccharibacteria bacterium]|nr:DUF192 domain-containing protein [Candidatus Saccharibacteria bacterium]